MKATVARVLLASTTAVFSWLAVATLAQTAQLLSTIDPAQGPPAGGGGDSWGPLVSPDARYVLFASTANNLLCATNGAAIPLRVPAPINVYLRDRTNATTTLVSVNLSGVAGGNGNSWPLGISTNGQFVLFESAASDLVSGDTNSATDVFVRDLLNGNTILVSVSTNGAIGNGASRAATMTPDGRYVAFVSAANNLVAADSNGIPDIFLRDLQTRTTAVVSAGAVSTNATGPSGGSEAPDITPNGRYVAFFSTATNLVPGVPPGGDIYVRDVVSASTVWASSYARTAVPSNSVFSFNHAISADALYVAYETSTPSNTVGTILRYNTSSGVTDVVHTNAAISIGSFVDARSLDLSPDGRFIAFIANTNGTVGSTTCAELWDGNTGNLRLLSGDANGQVQTNTLCDWPVVDPSGQRVAFVSTATNLVANALNGDYHIYLRNVGAGTTTLLDADTNSTGSPISASTIPAFSADFRFLAFESADASLVPNDRNRNYDVFLRDLIGGTNELISVHDPSLPTITPNGPSTLAATSVSSNGQYIAFISEADNVAPNDTNRCADIYVRDLANGTNLLVSVATNGYAGDGVSSDPAISSDGRYVVFSSQADNLVPGDTNNAVDVFLRDLQSGTTTLVSLSTNGVSPGNSDSHALAVASGGRYVLFRSYAVNLATGANPLPTDNLFLRDMQMATTYVLTVNGYYTGQAGDPLAAMTPDGRYVVYAAYVQLTSPPVYVWDTQRAARIYTNNADFFNGVGISDSGNRIAFAWRNSTTNGLSAADLSLKTTSVVGGGNYQRLHLSADGRLLVGIKVNFGPTNQIYLFDLSAGTNYLVSHAYGSTGGASAHSDSPQISSDGRFVAYRSAAVNIVSSDTNAVPDVFLYDVLTGVTTLLSMASSGAGAGNRSLTPVFSGDGQTLSFETWAPDLLAQDFNQSSDLVRVNLYAQGAIPVFQVTLVSSGPDQPLFLKWPVLPGKSYKVQLKTNLADPSWQDTAGAWIEGADGYFQDSAPDASQRFYRVVAF